MIIKKLRLQNYRNYDFLTLELKNNLNIIVGNNAQGKTNLLEALLFLSTTRSHRLKQDKDLIKHHQDVAICECVLFKDINHHLKIVINQQGKILYNSNNIIDKSSNYIGMLNAVLFSPSDIELFTASPKMRRRFIDVELGKVSSNYMVNLNNYHKLLKDRNSLLKRGIDDYHLYQAIETQLIQYQTSIIKYRVNFIKNINNYLARYYQLFTSTNDVVEIHYLSSISNLAQIESEFKDKYQKNFKNDLLTKATSFGIHREDILFTLNKINVNDHASQGQKRMIILALKLALVDYIKAVKKDSPILLLDDVLSELDINHQQLLFRLLPIDTQIVITTTEINAKLNISNYNLIKIENGKVI